MKNIFFLITCMFLVQIISAQDSLKSDSSQKIIHLDDIVVSANKTAEKKSEIPFSVETIGQKEMEFSNSQNTGDMLFNTGAVFVQKSQMGGSSPVLRGFEASKVLIVVDGVRMNNAIYRGGHLQDVMALDNCMLERTEIIFGPSSVIYGSDALGGVMHFYTKKPMFAEDSSMLVKTNSFFRFSSVNSEYTGHLDFNLGWKKFASLTSFTYSTFGDLRSGNLRDYVYDQAWTRDYFVETINGIDSMMKNPDRNIQKFSGYSQYDLLQKFAFKINDNIIETVNLQYSTSSDVPRYDRLTDWNGPNLKFAEWYYGPQERMLVSLNTEIKSDGNMFNRGNIVLAYQKISQDRINRRYKSKNKTFNLEDVAVYSLNADFYKNINEKNDLNYGIEITYNDVQSTAHVLDITTGLESPAATRYPDGGSNMSSYAAYLSHRIRISEKFIISDGLRYSASSLNAKFIDTTFFPLPYKQVEQKNKALTWTFGLVMKPNEDWKISLLASTGFRTPNVDDATKIFDSSPGTLIVVNKDLKPEQAMNFELSIDKYWKDVVKFEITGWYTKLTNAIVVKDFTYNGQDSVLYDGQMSRVQAAQNADDGYIYGTTGALLIDFSDNFSFKTAATFTYGRYNDSQNDTIIPLDHIPPAFGQTSLIFHSKKLQTEFYVRYNGWKELKDYSPSGEDNLNYATVYGMPSWTTLNIKLSYEMTKNIIINTGVENILDVHYRHFASGISAPGRNFYLTLRGKF